MQQGNWPEINQLGLRLNKLLGCPISMSGFGEVHMICKHGLGFSVKELQKNDDWTWVKREHDQWLSKKS